MIEDKEQDGIKFKREMIYTDMCSFFPFPETLFKTHTRCSVLSTLLLLVNGTDKYKISVIYETDEITIYVNMAFKVLSRSYSQCYTLKLFRGH